MRSPSKKAFEKLMSLGDKFLNFYGKNNIENYKKTQHYLIIVQQCTTSYCKWMLSKSSVVGSQKTGIISLITKLLLTAASEQNNFRKSGMVKT